MLKRGANVNAGDYGKRTALMDGVWIGAPSVIKLLPDKGADVNAVDENGNTALGIARIAGRKETIGLLQARGARK